MLGNSKARQDLSQLKILLAEDVKMNQIIVKKMIKKLNGDVDVASNGLEVLALMQQQKYDVILMDINMPEMDGYEATQRIRQHSDYRGQIIIGLSADNQGAVKATCLQMGMNDYLVKPFEPADLIEKIITLVK